MATLNRTTAEPRRAELSSLWRSHPAITAVGGAFVGALCVGLIQGTHPFYADSAGYWGLAGEFTQTGHFSLLTFTNPARGYLLPLAFYVLNLFATETFESQSIAVTVFNVLLFTLIGAVAAPRIAEVAWPTQRWGFARRMALTALLLIFWSGNLNYPLSDFPGLAMAVLALAAISRSNRPGWMLLAGLAAGAAINARPAYIALIPMLIVIVVLSWREKSARDETIARRTLCMLFLVAGLTLVSLPQSLSAHRYYNTWSPIPGSKAGYGVEESVTAVVLTNGIKQERWDSFERPAGVPNAIEYPYPSGKRLLDQQPEQKIKSTGQFIGLIVSHPTVMLPLLVRHVINGLDNRYSTTYIEDRANGGLIWLRVGGFVLVFLALVRLLWPAARRQLGRIRWRYPLALSLCCLTSIPTGIETRYLLPIYLLVYMVVLTPIWPNPIDSSKTGWSRFRTLGTLTVAAVVFTSVIWYVLSTGHPQTVYPA